MRPEARTTLACALLMVVAALAVAGCGGGGSDTIPEDQAETLKTGVEQARDYSNNGRCDDAEDQLADVNGQIEDLEISDDVRGGLEELVANLGDELANECEPKDETTSPTTTTSSTVPTTTPTTDTTDTTTTTDESTTTTTTSTTTTTTEPPSVEPTPPGNGPDGTGPPGQDGSGGTAPRKEAKSSGHEKKPKHEKDREKAK